MADVDTVVARYLNKHYDSNYEYRNVVLTREAANKVPRDRVMTEAEWRRLGVRQSRGWEHFAIHKPEPHILLFRRPLHMSNSQ
ncbi:hypothetical protein RCL1_002674 [Eukaryota sp. TZLM3-RCL]